MLRGGAAAVGLSRCVPMPTWLVTLLAVVVGGLLSYFVQVRLEGRREQRGRERERAADDAEMRVAMRLMLEDLDTINSHFEWLVQRGKYSVVTDAVTDFFLPVEAWETNRPTLARGLPDAQWDTLSPFMTTMQAVRHLVMEMEDESPVSEEDLDLFRRHAQKARDLYEMLSGRPAPTAPPRATAATKKPRKIRTTDRP